MLHQIYQLPDVRKISQKRQQLDNLVFAGQAEWDSVVMRVPIVLPRSEDVLIGTAFLKGHVVQVDYKVNTVGGPGKLGTKMGGHVVAFALP